MSAHGSGSMLFQCASEKNQCIESVSFWCGSGSASGMIDPVLDLDQCFFVVIFSLLFAYIKQNLFNKNLYFYNFGWFVCEFITIFFGTRIQINVSWCGSGQIIRIRPDSDPKHCLNESSINCFLVDPVTS